LVLFGSGFSVLQKFGSQQLKTDRCFKILKPTPKLTVSSVRFLVAPNSTEQYSNRHLLVAFVARALA